MAYQFGGRPMPRLSWVIPCLYATIDRFSNTVSLINVVEELQFPAEIPEPDPSKPLSAQGFTVVSHWMRESSATPERAKARLVLIGPKSRKPLGHAEFDIDLEGFQRARQVSHLPMFPFVGLGEYFVEVQIQHGKAWRRLSRTPIEVKQKPSAKES